MCRSLQRGFLPSSGWVGGVPEDQNYREVRFRLDRLDWGNNWSAFGLAVFIGAVIAVLATLLVFVWEFDILTSPAWQVGVHHLMLVLSLSLTSSWLPGVRFPSVSGSEGGCWSWRS